MKKSFIISCLLGFVFIAMTSVREASSNSREDRAERAAIATYTCNKLSRFLENGGKMLDNHKPAQEKNIEFAKELFEKKACK